MNPIILVCILVISAYAEEGKLPSSFKKCNRNHDDFKECLSSAVKDAVQQLTQPFDELHVPNLEPLDIPGMSVGDDEFTHIVESAKIYGLTKPESLTFDIDFEKNTAKLEIDVPQVRLQGTFELGGKLAGKPIPAGKGEGSIIVDKLHGSQTFTLKETTEKDNKKHLRVSSTKLTVSLGSLRVELEKTIEGDQATAEETIKHINENWEEAFKHSKNGYENLFGGLIYAIFDNILEKVPVDELFDQ